MSALGGTTKALKLLNGQRYTRTLRISVYLQPRGSTSSGFILERKALAGLASACA